MKKKEKIQKIIWIILVILITASMILWTLGSYLFF
jgi:hypothetical protein